MVTVQSYIDVSNILDMVRTFDNNLRNVEIFAAVEIERILKNEAFDSVVHRLAARAGPGFPSVYAYHLAFVMREIPIFIDTSGGKVFVEFSLETLGDYSDFQRGFHDEALVSEDESWTVHMSHVQLPYEGEPLYSDKDKRQEFWEEVIVNGNLGYELGITRGPGGPKRTVADLLGGMPTFEQVAAKRVDQAWGYSIAPEWLLLEYGYTESEPIVRPVDFTFALQSVAGCVGRQVYEQAVEGLIKAAEAAGGAVGVDVAGGARGRLRSVETGRFVEYRPEIGTIEVVGCLGGL